MVSVDPGIVQYGNARGLRALVMRILRQAPARCFELLLFLLMHQISLAISHDLGVAKTSSGDTQMLLTCQAVTFSTLITVPAFPDATLNKLMPAMAAAAGVTSMFAVIATRPPCQYASKKVLST